MKKKIAIIDGFYYIFRAYYSSLYLKQNVSKFKAVFFFINSILKIINSNEFEYIYVALDSKGKNQRTEILADYKKNRPKPPESLLYQIPFILNFLKYSKINNLSIASWEGDDIIASIVKKLYKYKENLDIIIFSSDKDLLQLVNNYTSVFLSNKKKEINIHNFYENIDLLPNQIIDFKAISGDPSDNIKGIPGIGNITTKKLLKKYHNINGIYNNLNLLNEKQKKVFLEFKNKINDYIKIIKLNDNLKFDFSLEDCSIEKKMNQNEKNILINFFEEIMSPSLIKKFRL